MVKIAKGDRQLTVPLGAYQNYYEPLGYGLLEAAEGLRNDPGMFTRGGGNFSNSEHSAASEAYTPEQIALMTTDQLYGVADKLGIDYQNVRTKDDLIELIIQTL